jgi:hypothetical protein
MRLEGEWTWHRWQLMWLEPEPDSLVVDLVELPEDATNQPGALVTLSFRGSGAAGPTELLDKLTTWMELDDGVCDCFHRASQPFGCLALFQGNDAVVVATMDPPA